MNTYALIANARRIRSLLDRARKCRVKDLDALFRECASPGEVWAVVFASGCKARAAKEKRSKKQ